MRTSEVIAQHFCATESHLKEAGNSQMFERSILSGAMIGSSISGCMPRQICRLLKGNMRRESEGESLCRSRRQYLSIVSLEEVGRLKLQVR